MKKSTLEELRCSTILWMFYNSPNGRTQQVQQLVIRISRLTSPSSVANWFGYTSKKSTMSRGHELPRWALGISSFPYRNSRCQRGPNCSSGLIFRLKVWIQSVRCAGDDLPCKQQVKWTSIRSNFRVIGQGRSLENNVYGPSYHVNVFGFIKAVSCFCICIYWLWRWQGRMLHACRDNSLCWHMHRTTACGDCIVPMIEKQ